MQLINGWRNNSVESVRDAVFYILVFKNEQKEFIKIGVTGRTIEERYRYNDTGFTIDKYLELEMKESVCYALEQFIKHELYQRNLAHRIHDLKGTTICGWSECYKKENLPDVLNLVGYFINGDYNVG